MIVFELDLNHWGFGVLGFWGFGGALFLIYVNDAEACLSLNTRMGVYADDTTLYTIIRRMEDSIASDADMQSSPPQHLGYPVESPI